MAEDPLVSVVTPFYNTAEYLEECIVSVLGQDYTRWEYVLLDNCSTDGSTEIAERYSRQDPGGLGFGERGAGLGRGLTCVASSSRRDGRNFTTAVSGFCTVWPVCRPRG